MTGFLRHLVLGLGVVAGAACLLVLLDRLFSISAGRPGVLAWTGVVAAVVVAGVTAVVNRPSLKWAAIEVDRELGLKEKFSNALYLRGNTDSFARAAVMDAEEVAREVNLDGRFRVRWPQRAWVVPLIALAALLLAQLDRRDWLGREERQRQAMAKAAEQESARKAVSEALAAVQAAPVAVADSEAIRKARQELEELLRQPAIDPEAARRAGVKAMQDYQDTLKDQIRSNRKFAEARGAMKSFASMMPPENQKGPVSEAQRSLARGDFSEAAKKLEELTRQFDKLDPAQQRQAAEQMKQMAEALRQRASEPQAQEQMRQQLQQLGLNPEQSREAMEMMKQAAQGDRRAVEKLQQLARQAMDQMNNGQGADPGQQEQIQRMLQEMQAGANEQEMSRQMHEAAEQLAQAMREATGQQQGEGQGMAEAAAAMAAQLQELEAIMNDLRQMQAAQGQAAAAMGQCSGGKGLPGEQAAGQGRWEAGDIDRFGGRGNGGAGQGTGDRSGKQSTPFGVKEEISESESDEKGRILASTLIKSPAVKGESKQLLREVAESARRELADEVDEERISRQSSGVVRRYFSTLGQDAPPEPAANGEKP